MNPLECLFLGHIPDLNECWEGSSECPGQRFTGKSICKRCGNLLKFYYEEDFHINGGIHLYSRWRIFEKS